MRIRFYPQNNGWYRSVGDNALSLLQMGNLGDFFAPISFLGDTTVAHVSASIRE